MKFKPEDIVHFLIPIGTASQIWVNGIIEKFEYYFDNGRGKIAWYRAWFDWGEKTEEIVLPEWSIYIGEYKER